MKTFNLAIAMMSVLTLGLSAFAGQANSSASASSPGWGPGTASATAGYDGGGIGFAQTDTRSGKVNLAKGLSFGFDEEGLSLSSSFAVAPTLGPAAAGTFNLALGLDGDVSYSVGRTTATGDPYRSVSAGGSATPGRFGRPGTAVAGVNGRTGPLGRVLARTHSQTSRPTVVRRVPTRRILRRR